MCGFPGVALVLRSGFSALPLTIIGGVLASMLTTGGVGASAATSTPIPVSFVTPVPGAPGVTFGVYPTPPVFDGQRVVFASQLPSTVFRGLWSAAPDGSGLLTLADDSTFEASSPFAAAIAAARSHGPLQSNGMCLLEFVVH